MNIIEQGLAIERELLGATAELADKMENMRNRTWRMADWLAANTRVAARKPELRALEPRMYGSHVVNLSEYAQHSSFTRQRLIEIRRAALMSQKAGYRPTGLSVAMVNKTLMACGYDIKLTTDELPSALSNKHQRKARPITFVTALSDVSGARRLLEAAYDHLDMLINAQNVKIEDDDILSTLSNELTEIESLKDSILSIAGMSEPALA